MFAIRCPENRKHKSASNGIEYPTCGHLIAAIDNGVVFLRCPICKIFWELEILGNDNIRLKKVLDKKTTLKSALRAID